MTKRLAATVAVLVLLAAAGAGGFYLWQLNRFQSGPRTTRPDVVIEEYTGPGSLAAQRTADTPPTAP